MASPDSELTQFILNASTCADRVALHRTSVSPEEVAASVAATIRFSVENTSDGPISIVEDRKLEGPPDWSANLTYFAPHTDGAYYKHVPEFVILYCLDPGQQQTPTVFLDTVKALDHVRENHPAHYRVLRRLEQVFVRNNGRECSRPVIETHPITGREVVNITLGRAFVRPLGYPANIAEMPHQQEMVEAVAALTNALWQSKVYEQQWEKGALLLWDNNTLIHGRMEGSGNSSRRLVRIWLRDNVVHKQESEPKVALRLREEA